MPSAVHPQGPQRRRALLRGSAGGFVFFLKRVGEGTGAELICHMGLRTLEWCFCWRMEWF